MFHVEHELLLRERYKSYRARKEDMFHVEHEGEKLNSRADWEDGYGEVVAWMVSRGTDLSLSQRISLYDYCRLLHAASEKANLISPRDRGDLAIRHILPSLCMGKVLSLVPNKVVLDFGSGAGIPGIPLKILYPESHFILVESRRKRANFLRDVVRRLKLSSIDVHNNRIEDLHAQLSESVDVVVTRAVSDLTGLRFWVDPVLKPHGVAITTLDSHRGYHRSRGVLLRRQNEALGQINWFGVLR